MESPNIAPGKQDIITIRTFQNERYVLKKITDPFDISYIIEHAVSQRMQACDQIYTVLGTKTKDGMVSLVSKYIAGEDLNESLKHLNEDELYSLVCQVLLLIYLLNISGISHNDLHCGNVRVQTTTQETLRYFCLGRTYEIPTYGRKAVIIDFGASLIWDIDKRLSPTSSIMIGDSFLRLDVRYDLWRFLQSFNDCLAWDNSGKCKKLKQFIVSEITNPLKLGIYGVPPVYIHMFPKVFDGYLKTLISVSFTVSSDIIGILCSWPDKVKYNNLKEVKDAIKFIKTATTIDLHHIVAYVLNKYKHDVVKKFIPLVAIWQEFLESNTIRKIQNGIKHDFERSIVQTPLFVVDWLLLKKQR